MSWQQLGFVKASSYRTKIVLALRGSVKTPSEISRQTGIHKGNVSKVLGELQKKGFVVCLNPSSKKGRLYRLTNDGQNVAKKLG